MGMGRWHFGSGVGFEVKFLEVGEIQGSGVGYLTSAFKGFGFRLRDSVFSFRFCLGIRFSGLFRGSVFGVGYLTSASAARACETQSPPFACLGFRISDRGSSVYDQGTGPRLKRALP